MALSTLEAAEHKIKVGKWHFEREELIRHERDVSGIDGTFRFVDLSAGEYTVIATGYPPVATVLQVASGSRAEQDLHLGHAD